MKLTRTHSLSRVVVMLIGTGVGAVARVVTSTDVRP